ncbi:MAG: hypothetical protein AAFY02_12215 [Pseudomonadota bacterium]
MSKSDDFIDQGHAQLEEWRKRLAEMEAMAQKSRESFDSQIADLRHRMEKAEADFKQAQAAGVAHAEDYQNRVKAAWASMEEGWQKAMRDLTGGKS